MHCAPGLLVMIHCIVTGILTSGCQEAMPIPYTWWVGAILFCVIPHTLLYFLLSFVVFFVIVAEILKMGIHTAACDLLFSPPPPPCACLRVVPPHSDLAFSAIVALSEKEKGCFVACMLHTKQSAEYSTHGHWQPDLSYHLVCLLHFSIHKTLLAMPLRLFPGRTSVQYVQYPAYGSHETGWETATGMPYETTRLLPGTASAITLRVCLSHVQ